MGFEQLGPAREVELAMNKLQPAVVTNKSVFDKV